jgi:hypothetical protein
MAYDMTSEVETAISVVRAFLHESWLAICERNVPFSREDFRREYSAVLPGATFEDDIFPTFITARWQRPAD